MKRRNNVKEIVLAMPFFAVLFYISILGYIIPLRPTVSQSEKRALEKYPVFSFSSFFSGNYFDEITTWYSDTFPGREGWIKINKITKSLQGFNYRSVNVSHLKENEAIPEPSMESAEPVEISPTPTEFYMEAQPTEFGFVDPDQVDIEIYSGSIQIDGTVYASQGFSKTASDNYLKYINKFSETCAEKGIRLYNVIAPTSVGIILPDEIRQQVNCADQGKTLQYIFSNSSSYINCVKTYDYIKEHSNEYIYYHADHHWTGLGAYYAYLAFCESAHISPVSLDDYKKLDEGKFLGSFIASASLSGKIKSDTITAYIPIGNIYLLDATWDNQWALGELVQDYSDRGISEKYNTYLGGDKRLCMIVNDDLDDSSKSCLVIKDSFGNPFSIYLSKHYKNTYILDYRKLNFDLTEFIEDKNIDDIIICQSIGVSQSNSANGLLGQVLNGLSG